MNTLSKHSTSTFLTAEQRDQVIARWREGFDRPKSATYHLLYALLLGRNWQRAFTPYTNATKLANGVYTHWSFWRAYRILQAFAPVQRGPRVSDEQWAWLRTHQEQRLQHFLAPFAGTVTPAMVQAAIAYLPQVRQQDFAASDFAPGRWPFEAYVLPAEAVACAS